MQVSRRAVLPDDESFLQRLLTATAAEELHAHLWPENQRDSLLKLQYNVRRQGMLANYPHGIQEIILLNGVPAGYLVVARSHTEILVADIAILAEYRCIGIGTCILRELFAESDCSGAPVRLSVNTTNRAIGLYERLGFRRKGGNEVQYFMERPPVGPESSGPVT